ncbi:MAG: M24 family metallopeptidase [Anaerolineae bacterium]
MPHNYDARMRALQTSVAAAGLDAYLVTSRDSIYYLTGASYKPLERPFFIIVRRAGAPDLLVPLLERGHMRKAKGFGAVNAYYEYPAPTGENWFEVLNGMLGPASVVGLEPTTPLELANQLAVGRTVCLPLVDALRLVKSSDEVEAARSAARWADEGMRRLLANLYDGVSVIELFSLGRAIQTEVIKTGDFDALNSEFLTVGWPAPQSAQPHSVPELDARLGRGPLVLMSFHRVNGYAAECERTAFIGAPSAEEQRLFSVMLKARAAALALVKPGARCAEIDQAARAVLAGEGLSDYILHRSGHGIGLGNHEPPWVALGSADILREDMLISIEPGFYLPEVGGFRHSDTVLVTADGYECLTHSPTDLDSLVVRSARPLKRLKGALMRRVLRMR